MSLVRYFASSKKIDLICVQPEAGDNTKKSEKTDQLQFSQRMMIFLWKD